MARPGSPQHSSDNEDSEPELLTLSSTKRESRSRAEAVNAYQAAQKAKRKRENRVRDAALQEAKGRAREEREQREAQGDQGPTKRKRRPKEKVEDAANAEERMERAMREAAGEDGSGSETMVSPLKGGGEDDEEWHGIMASDIDVETVEDTSRVSSNHLPEHLFSVAAAVSRSTSLKKIPPASTDKLTKKKRTKSKPKELIVGSRTLRTLPALQADTLMASLTLPPARINRFLKRTLHLKETKSDKKNWKSNTSKTKEGASQTWERRPANVGVLRSTGGPALRFVRGT